MVFNKRDTKRDKEVLKMREKMHMTFVDIAKELGISKPRVRQLYMRLVKERESKKEVA